MVTEKTIADPTALAVLLVIAAISLCSVTIFFWILKNITRFVQISKIPTQCNNVIYDRSEGAEYYKACQLNEISAKLAGQKCFSENVADSPTELIDNARWLPEGSDKTMVWKYNLLLRGKNSKDYKVICATMRSKTVTMEQNNRGKVMETSELIGTFRNPAVVSHFIRQFVMDR